MSEKQDEQMREKLHHLQDEHSDLDAAIAALAMQGTYDQLRMMRMKKRKLQLKDQIALVEDMLYPDIIA